MFFIFIFYQRCFRVQLPLCLSARLVSVGVAVAAVAVAVVGLSVNATQRQHGRAKIPSPVANNKKEFLLVRKDHTTLLF